ncbi:uncharacterized protein TrAFT101_005826 [Trichoderma asperellum]|uniref:uncharacterized protein n=1 Tax=Trichoderma asperellum TaxID=101201 RepID=UPI00332F3FFD|nr:hypothetical protein TrAFT101_005826 [Trichoderma asperellum]
MATVLYSLYYPLKYRDLSGLFFPSPVLEPLPLQKIKLQLFRLGCLINFQGDESWEINEKKTAANTSFYDERQVSAVVKTCRNMIGTTIFRWLDMRKKASG